MSIVVFLGPSLPVAEARDILEADFRPPASAGDLYGVMARKPKIVAVIDGVFGQVPSLWHKEVLFALAEGVHVYGASSMGALRAAELHSFGMVGVGEVFEAYRSGEIDDDDEVAVAHGPASRAFAPTSDAMVNLRDGLRRACQAGAIGRETCEALVRSAKKRFYAERSWKMLLADGRTLGLPKSELAALRDFVARTRPNLKRDDALLVLRHLADQGGEILPHVASFDFHPTCNWVALTEAVGASAQLATAEGGDAEATTFESVQRHLLVAGGHRSELVRSALAMHLLAAESDRIELEVEASDLQAAAERVSRGHGEGATEDDLTQLATAEVIGEELFARRAANLGPFLRLAVARHGKLGEMVALVERKQRWLEQRGYGLPEVSHTGLGVGGLMRWYQVRTGLEEVSVEVCADKLGFPSPRTFLSELAGQYLYAEGLRRESTTLDGPGRAAVAAG